MAYGFDFVPGARVRIIDIEHYQNTEGTLIRRIHKQEDIDAKENPFRIVSEKDPIRIDADEDELESSKSSGESFVDEEGQEHHHKHKRS